MLINKIGASDDRLQVKGRGEEKNQNRQSTAVDAKMSPFLSRLGFCRFFSF
jgi:hypothetical protein